MGRRGHWCARKGIFSRSFYCGRRNWDGILRNKRGDDGDDGVRVRKERRGGEKMGDAENTRARCCFRSVKAPGMNFSFLIIHLGERDGGFR